MIVKTWTEQVTQIVLSFFQKLPAFSCVPFYEHSSYTTWLISCYPDEGFSLFTLRNVRDKVLVVIKFSATFKHLCGDLFLPMSYLQGISRFRRYIFFNLAKSTLDLFSQQNYILYLLSKNSRKQLILKKVNYGKKSLMVAAV